MVTTRAEEQPARIPSRADGEAARRPLGELLTAAQRDVTELVARLAGPDWRAVDHAGHDPAILPGMLAATERLARLVSAVQTRLAGHLAEAYEHEVDRHELLGIPPGKSPHRNAAECLAGLLHIDRREARRRIQRAAATGERRDFTTAPVSEPDLPCLAQALAAGTADVGACDIVVETLTRARADAAIAGVPAARVDDVITAGERLLTEQLDVLDPDGIRRLCVRWRQHLDAVLLPDTDTPGDAELDAARGLFHRGRRRGLHRWELLLTDVQHEVLQTVASAATQPRGAGPREQGAPADPRSRGQRQADVLVSALQAALAHADRSTFPLTGGHRPQVLVTIDHDTLLGRLRDAWAAGAAQVAGTALSSADFTGPIDQRHLRRLACDADLIPVVLGGEGEILDLGRARRLFTRAQRRAITARDGGCAAPGCHLPAAWCEVHHIGHWEHGGPTDVANGVLLCSHHHHAVHAGWWEVTVTDGVPWFTPARHLDPDRIPRRNLVHRTHPWPTDSPAAHLPNPPTPDPGEPPTPDPPEPPVAVPAQRPRPRAPRRFPEPWTVLRPPRHPGRAPRAPALRPRP